jgi:hypothetical protein
MSLLHILMALQKKAPIHFEIGACTVDPQVFFLYSYPYATSVCGLKLLVYEALSYQRMRP